MYLVALSVAAVLSVSGQNAGIVWQVVIGATGIAGVAIVVVAAVVVAGQLLGSGRRAVTGFRKGKK